jgi:hypothetical protein
MYILDLQGSWRCTVGFTSGPLNIRGKETLYTLDWRLGLPQIDLDDVKKRQILTLMRIKLS